MNPFIPCMWFLNAFAQVKRPYSNTGRLFDHFKFSLIRITKQRFTQKTLGTDETLYYHYWLTRTSQFPKDVKEHNNHSLCNTVLPAELYPCCSTASVISNFRFCARIGRKDLYSNASPTRWDSLSVRCSRYTYWMCRIDQRRRSEDPRTWDWGDKNAIFPRGSCFGYENVMLVGVSLTKMLARAGHRVITFKKILQTNVLVTKT